MPPVAKPPPKAGEKKKRRKKRKKLVMRQLKLKGLWMKTPEDWAYFYEWAKKNAAPRQLPPPEPINRGPKKRLSKFKKRLRTLSLPRLRGTQDCLALPIPVRSAALKAKPSKRTKMLALPILRFLDDCRDWRIRRPALVYEASERILFLSLPRFREEPNDCKELGIVSPAAMRRIPTDKDCMLSRPKQMHGEDQCEERSIECDDSELSPWVDFLAIPSYRVLKEMHNVHLADKFKKRFLDEVDKRPKQAYKEQMKKQKKKKERDKRKKEADKRKKKQAAKKAMSSYSKSTLADSRTDVGSEGGQDDEEPDDDEVAAKSTKSAPEDSAAEDAEDAEEEGEGEEEEEEDERMKKRKKEKEAWRYKEVGCRKLPAEIPMSALKYEASDAIVILAVPKSYPKDLCKNPYIISEEAKNASASPRVQELAKPKHQCDPVTRPEPREKDEWGRPIFPPREYGKKLPKVKPYKPRECPKKEATSGEDGEGKDEFESDTQEDLEMEAWDTETGTSIGKENTVRSQRSIKKARHIDPIANEPTIDPLFNPTGAMKQRNSRKLLKEQKEREQAEKDKAKKDAENAPDQSTTIASDNE